MGPGGSAVRHAVRGNRAGHDRPAADHAVATDLDPAEHRHVGRDPRELPDPDGLAARRVLFIESVVRVIDAGTGADHGTLRDVDPLLR